jgi:tripartite ATP-independent transporter DctM subunit
MELLFLTLLVLLMAGALASGFPVAFALPGSAIISIGLAALSGYLFAGDSAAYFAQGGPMNWLTAGVTNFRGIYWEVERDTLIAIPLFVFMGIMLQRSKIAEDLLVSMAQLFGPIRGGLGISVVFVGALLAATTGIVGATVVAMGLISLPAMLRNNYSHAMATGTIAASGTLGQIIPPSIVLIILADQLANAVDQAGMARTAYYKATTGNFSLPSEFGVASTSAGDMFMGALLPGLVLVGLYMLYILIVSYVRRDVAPAVSYEGQYDQEFFGRVFLSLIPPLTLIFVVLGSIIMGIATVNQAGAIGAAGATIMAGYRLYEGKRGAFAPAILSLVSLTAIIIITQIYSINVKDIKTSSDVVGTVLAVIAVTFFVFSLIWSGWRTLKIERTLQGVMMETAKTTSLVFIILLGAAMLTAAFRAFGGEELVREFLSGLPGGFWMQFIIVMAVIFILGFFLDFIEIAVVVVPIVAPILLADPSANVTAVWLGVMIGLNIQTSFLTPPFGFALFYLRGVAPSVVRTISMYKGVIPFIALQLFALVIVGNFPQLVNYLPNRLSLTAETAPPPKNPRLQLCIEQYLSDEFERDGGMLRQKIADARQWKLNGVPKKIQDSVFKALIQADSSFQLLDDVFAASARIEEAAGVYRPLQTQVRKTQVEITKLTNESKVLARDLDRLRRQVGAESPHAVVKADELEGIKDRIATLSAEIPNAWASTQKEFAKLLSNEKRARLTFRRAVDQSYSAIRDFKAAIDGSEALRILDEHIADLRVVIETQTPVEATAIIRKIESEVGRIAGAGDVRSALSKVRRALRGTKASRKKALYELTKLNTVYQSEVAWRDTAKATLQTPVSEFQNAIRKTIGLRQQTRLPYGIALQVAGCNADHRDISLYF